MFREREAGHQLRLAGVVDGGHEYPLGLVTEALEVAVLHYLADGVEILAELVVGQFFCYFLGDEVPYEYDDVGTHLFKALQECLEGPLSDNLV